MRIVQLIDSLEAGGAESMAVNYANVLISYTGFSGLVVTRQEGLLKDKIKPEVNYLFLNRKKVFDFRAVFLFRNFIITHKVTHIQAHSSSFFIAVILKMIIPSIKIIWHDHYGFRYKNTFFQNLPLILCSLFFNRIIVVNNLLKDFAKRMLLCKKVIYLPNFVDFEKAKEDFFELKGNQGKRILCLANLRPQKNHIMLLEVAKEVIEKFPDWTFHFVGQDNNDEYSRQLKSTINEFSLQENVFMYGSVSAVQSVVEQSQIGVLSSTSEGLPLALLEYGRAALPVVVTAVGEVPLIVDEKKGFCVASEDKISFSRSLEELIKNEELRNRLGQNLKEKVSEEFGVKKIITNFISFVNHGTASSNAK